MWMWPGAWWVGSPWAAAVTQGGRGWGAAHTGRTHVWHGVPAAPGSIHEAGGCTASARLLANSLNRSHAHAHPPPSSHRTQQLHACVRAWQLAPPDATAIMPCRLLGRAGLPLPRRPGGALRAGAHAGGGGLRMLEGSCLPPAVHRGRVLLRAAAYSPTTCGTEGCGRGVGRGASGPAGQCAQCAGQPVRGKLCRGSLCRGSLRGAACAGATRVVWCAPPESTLTGPAPLP